MGAIQGAWERGNRAEETAKTAPAVPLLETKACWRRLPKTVSGGGQPLPSWVRGMVASLPRTAAAMLRLDLAHRTLNPLDPVLRGQMRWVVARANGCAYHESYALSDLRRAGLDDVAIQILLGSCDQWPEAVRAPLEFARLLTVAAPTIPDSLFAELRTRFGDRQVAAMVLLAAYGNFQDRLALGLNLPMEEGGPLGPLDVQFVEGTFQVEPLFPEHQASVTSQPGTGDAVVPEDAEWGAVTYADLQSRLEQQRDRQPRLPIPSWDDVKTLLPPEMGKSPTRLVWNLVCSGYVPELAVPWSLATRTMWAETEPDRVFEESLFWIQTRAVGCNYCMGHCEMLLEVAGLHAEEVADRTERLGSANWSSFSPIEQRCYAYARKLSQTPWELTPADYESLVADLGADQAMATFWWLCRGLYMTRVSDGFQLPLERENVFSH